MATITSRHNPLVKRIRDAIRNHEDEIVIEGVKAVQDAVAQGWTPIALLHRGVEISAEIFDSLTETKSPQDVIALFQRPQPATLFAREESIVVALDGVQDPGNVGTIIRLAAAFDAGAVALLPNCADAYSPKAIRASVGAVLNVSVAPATIDDLVRSGWPIFAADGAGDVIEPPATRAILVFGSEGAGVSAEIRQHATRIAIPTAGKVESLNVAASAAILLSKSYEARR